MIFSGSLIFAVKKAAFWGVSAYALTPQNAGAYHRNSYRTVFLNHWRAGAALEELSIT